MGVVSRKVLFSIKMSLMVLPTSEDPFLKENLY